MCSKPAGRNIIIAQLEILGTRHNVIWRMIGRANCSLTTTANLAWISFRISPPEKRCIARKQFLCHFSIPQSIGPVLLGLTIQLPSHQWEGVNATDGLYILHSQCLMSGWYRERHSDGAKTGKPHSYIQTYQAIGIETSICQMRCWR